MALNFPDNPTLNQIYTDNNSGFTYRWNGSAWVNYAASGTVEIQDGAVTPVKLSTGGPNWDTQGNVTITGIGTTALLVDGNARVTGILTVGTGSVTINGTNNTINVGSGLTLSSDGVVANTVTATNFVGNGSGLVGINTTKTLTIGTRTNAASINLVGTAMTISLRSGIATLNF